MSILGLNLIQQVIAVFILLQFFFAYLEYQVSPDVLEIVPKLFSKKYILPSLIIPPIYIIVVLSLQFLFS